MKKYEKIYNELSKQYTDEEIVESMLIPEDLTLEQQKKTKEETGALRFKMLREQTEKQRIYSDLLRFKYLMEDYIKEKAFDEDKTLGKHIEEYVRIIKRTKKKLSEDLSVHYTRLSRIINDREEANIEFIYRLEKHSANLIPALYWWKLVIKQQEHIIKKDEGTRQKEAAKVKNAVRFRA